MARAVWSGNIVAGVFKVKTKVFKAGRETKTGIHQYSPCCHQPVGYKLYCKGCGKEIEDKKEIMKGIEIIKGEPMLFAGEEIKALKVKGSEEIVIDRFVPDYEIANNYADSINQTYKIIPAEKNEKKFAVLLRGMEKNKVVAVGKVAMREGRDNVVFIKPYGDTLLMATVFYEEEVTKNSELYAMYSLPEVSETELELGCELISNLTEGGNEWSMTIYHNKYMDNLIEAIEMKEKGIEIPTIKVEEEQDLTELLKASVKATAK